MGLGFERVGDDPATAGPRRDEAPVMELTVARDDDPIDLLLDEDPRLTVAFVRPWLLRRPRR